MRRGIGGVQGGVRGGVRAGLEEDNDSEVLWLMRDGAARPEGLHIEWLWTPALKDTINVMAKFLLS